ncbi:MAG: hypothetical protein ACFB0G_10550 [Leptolyngbyaceae cyanobacterium]
MSPEANSSSPGGAHYEHTVLRQQIQQSLQKVEAQKQRLKSTDRRYTIINIVLGVVATFIAGESAVTGEPFLGNWRLTTMVASVCTLSATAITGIQKQIASPEQLLETSECAAKLKALKVETISANYELEPVSDIYQGIISEFPGVDC